MTTKQADPILAARVPKKLIRELDRAAKQGGRTRSNELRMRLERSLRDIPLLASVR